MAVLKRRLTDRVIDDLPPAGDGQYIVRDDKQAGFYVLVGKRAKTFMLRTDVRDALGERRTVKEKIARVEDMTATEARLTAQARLAELRTNGVAETETVTLRETAGMYFDDCRRRRLSPRTIESYEHAVFVALPRRWLDRPLADLAASAEARRAVRQAHDDMTRERGAYAANRAFQTLRTVYNFALKAFDDLPPKNPTLLVRFNEERRADEALDETGLRAWWAALESVENPIRAAMHAFILLSGHRPDAIKKARWEHLDVRRRALHVPEPKGGRRRAFDIPLSRPMLRALNRAKKAGRVLYPGSEWIFPGPRGRVFEHKESGLPATHKALRHTYAAVAATLGVPPLFLKLLMNHKVADVTDGYAAGGSLHPVLAAEQERISRALCRSEECTNGRYQISGS